MNFELTTEIIQNICCGTDVYTAVQKLQRMFPYFDSEHIDIHYIESSEPRFTIISGRWDPVRKTAVLEAASQSPVRHLPANFQSNDFLRDFLMIFQHIMNGNSLLLDNMYRYFRPMECPVDFLPVLSDWLGIYPETLGGERIVRRFLQNAITLYRCRGTVAGLKAHLTIVSGVTPEILEGMIPYRPMDIQDSSLVENSLFESGYDEDCFTVHFPVPRSAFDDGLVKRLSLIVQMEKPVHTTCYLSFEKPPAQQRPITTMAENETFMSNGGISI